MVAAFMVYGTALAAGTTITVNTAEDKTNDDGDCSLREAIEAADTNAQVDGCPAGSSSQRDTILFALGKEATTITLGSTLPFLTDGAGLLIYGGSAAAITISGNDAVRVFFVNSGAGLDLKNLTVADGLAAFGVGGGIYNGRGTLTVTNSTFSGNSATDIGGGILNDEGTLEVTNSTFSGNSALDGGGIYNDDGTLTVTNSTFSGNSADDFGGGIANGGALTLKNTIVANSTSGGNCFGTITDGGYNIDDGNTCGFGQATSRSDTDPKLGSLAKNGGPTQTIALKKGSPALNAIPDGVNGCGIELDTDQRGVLRPEGEGCEIGAFEKKPRRR
jgi:CSLREA domain-containing protein